jgi:hypothetical protein
VGAIDTGEFFLNQLLGKNNTRKFFPARLLDMIDTGEFFPNQLLRLK